MTQIRLVCLNMRMNDSDLIDKLGGTAEVAKLCEVSPAAVSQWRTDGIPRARRMFIKVIRPEAFEDESREKAA